MASVVVLADDIFFGSKIRETARRTGVNLAIASSAEAFRKEIESGAPSLAVVDLSARATPLEAIRELRAAHPHVRIIGYVSHVQAELAAQARAAGCTEVMPRSKFSQELAQFLRGANAPSDVLRGAENGPE